VGSNRVGLIIIKRAMTEIVDGLCDAILFAFAGSSDFLFDGRHGDGDAGDFVLLAPDNKRGTVSIGEDRLSALCSAGDLFEDHNLDRLLLVKICEEIV
jgi:hypothetical protein